MDTDRRRATKASVWVLGLCVAGFSSAAFGAEGRKELAPADGPRVISNLGESAMDHFGPDDIIPVPDHYRVTKHTRYLDGSTAPATAAVGPEKLIYGNTLGQKIIKFVTTTRRYADDLITDSIAGCNMTRYVVRVNGGVPGGGGEFSCTTALFTGCPHSTGGGSLIPGTLMTFDNLADDISEMHDLELVAPMGMPIPLETRVWVRVGCNIGTAGWVGGSPAEIGFTQDIFLHPNVGCNAYLSSEFYAGFFTQIFADDPPAMPCETHFLAYAAAQPSFPPLACGPDVPCADDFQTSLAPTNETCVLSAYSVGLKGSVGPYNITIDMRVPFTDFPIVGTEFTFQGRGDGRPELAYYVVDPNLEVVIPPTPLWVKWSADRGQTGPINSHISDAGFSASEYFVRMTTQIPAFWQPVGVGLRNINQWNSIFLTVYCRGATPRGACCQNQIAAANQLIQCQDNLPITACKRPKRWLKDKLCAEDVFDPPCGTHACCTPNSCLDLGFSQCATFLDQTSLGLPCQNSTHCPGRVCQPDGFCSPRKGVWQNNGGFCDPGSPVGPEYDCLFYQCYFALGDCFVEEQEIACPLGNECPLGTKCLGPPENVCSGRGGCNNTLCCDRVCNTDPFCCTVIWDAPCVGYANVPDNQDCSLPPGNDVCANDSSPSQGAQPIMLTQEPGLPKWTGFVSNANNQAAFPNLGDPLACCNSAGANSAVAGTLWYKFVAPLPPPGFNPITTARIHTCNTAGSATATNPLLAVFSVGDLSTEASSCGSLTIIGCNDDSEDCGSGQQADVCVQGLAPGNTYYVMLGTSNSVFQGPYSIDIEMPCTRLLPSNNTCGGAQLMPIANNISANFDTTNATIDCPSEECVPAMKTDLWYEYIGPCLGSVTFQTCGATAGDADPPTAIAVYRPPNPNDSCDVDTNDIIGCNDNALVNTAEHARRSQTCGFSGLECDTAAQCQFRCSIGGSPCSTIKDCYYCALQPNRHCLDNTDCMNCFFLDVNNNPVPCTVASTVPTAECPGANNLCRFNNTNNCVHPNDAPPEIFEVCAKEPCLSSCGNAASVTVPVTPSQLLKIRLGGDFGEEVQGTMRATCVVQDCNSNNIPDLAEINAGTASDCNENEKIDTCEIAQNSAPDCNTNGKPDQCEIDRDSTAPGGPFFCIANCAADADNNGIPDVCTANPCNQITASVPADCDIDARQPHDLKNAIPAQGITTLQLTLNATGCAAGTLTAAHFTVTTQPGGSTPTIQSVNGAGNVATITFLTPIPTNQWTCVSLTTVPAQQVCVGFLPGDVNASRVTGTPDTTALVAAIDNSIPRPLLQTDMNRSGVLTAEDLIGHLNLLNGGDAYVSWSGQQITVPCP